MGNTKMSDHLALPHMAPKPMLARLVVEDHFRGLSLMRRLALAVRLVLIARPARAGVIDMPLSAHLRADVGLPARTDRVEPPEWYPPPLY